MIYLVLYFYISDDLNHLMSANVAKYLRIRKLLVLIKIKATYI